MDERVNIDRFIASPESLLTLCRDVVVALDEKRKRRGFDDKEKQLKEISNTIEKLEKLGVTIPDPLRSLKTDLISELSSKTEADNAIKKLDEGFESIARELHLRTGKGTEYHVGSGPVKPRKKRSQLNMTDNATLRKEIISALKKFGGKARISEIYSEVEKQLNGKWLPGDLEKRNNGEPVWHNRCRWARLIMRHEGLLKNDSPHGIWELSEAYL